jgi:hypothetical protein
MIRNPTASHGTGNHGNAVQTTASHCKPSWQTMAIHGIARQATAPETMPRETTNGKDLPWFAVAAVPWLAMAEKTMSNYGKPCQPMSNFGKPFQTMSNFGKPCQTMANHVKPCQTLANHVKPWQTVANHFKPFQTIANHVKPWQTVANHGKPCQTMSTAIASKPPSKNPMMMMMMTTTMTTMTVSVLLHEKNV